MQGVVRRTYLHGLNGEISLLITDGGPELYSLQSYLVIVRLHGIQCDLRKRWVREGERVQSMGDRQEKRGQ